MSSNEEFTFTWEIENFNLHPQKYNEWMYSPTFFLKQFLNTEWYLRFYLLAYGTEPASFVDCCLCRSDDNGPEEIKIDFKLSVNGEVYEKTHSFLKDSEKGCGDGLCKLMDNHILVIECHMRMSVSNVTTVDFTKTQNHYLLPCVWKSPFITSEIMKETHEAVVRKGDKSLKELLPYSNQAFARTRFFKERKFYMFAIPDYFYPGSKHKQHIPLKLASTTLLIGLFMNTQDNSDVLEIEICFENKSKSNCVLICKIEYLDSKREINFSAEEVHLFEIGLEQQSWNFGHPYKWSDLKEKKIASLRFILTFSNGQHFSEIEKITEEDDCFDLLNLPNDVSQDLYRLFTEKRLCDVTIRVQDKSLEVHKTVLCSRSPVFAAMFESGMKENSTNIIQIDDLDANAISQMLHFMYTGDIEELNDENSMELFSAADKYQITSLKDICRNVLKNNLTIQNICSVLLLADKHQDEELSKAAVVFICYHKYDILKSEEWKELKEGNVFLVLETLTKVCGKLFP